MGSSRDVTEGHRVEGLMSAKSIMPLSLPTGMVWSLESGVPAQVSSLSLNRGSKLHNPSPITLVFLEITM
ncbi:hypothetical protein TNCV_4131711 [Trichonephila clavipes]|nr:hypothetical protein TNCV_4131711 [Trichonephila clavipes]